MLSNYLKIAFRTLRRQGLNALVNILGLALGIAAAFVIGIYIRQELTYDRGFEHSERIYRVATDFFSLGGFAKSQQQLVDELPGAVPAIEWATRFDALGEPIPVWVDENQYLVSSALRVDSSFFDMFSFEFIEGDPQRAILNPGELFLSEEMAVQFFGEGAAVGESVRIGEDERVMQVAGVVKKPPFKTHLEADMWLPLGPLEAPPFGSANAQFYNYFRLMPGQNAQVLEKGLRRYLETTVYPSSGVDMPFEEWVQSPMAVQFWVQPLREIYLHSKFNLELIPGGNPTQVYVLGIIGVFLLLIAGFNYVNLTTAASVAREKEIGVKLSMGVQRGMLIQQFLIESIAISCIAMVGAVGLSELLLSYFEFVTGTVLVASIISNYTYLLALLAFSVLVGLTAGLYPAFYLSMKRPVHLLKGMGTPPEGGRKGVRTVLVVAQFTIAIILIAGSAGFTSNLPI